MPPFEFFLSKSRAKENMFLVYKYKSINRYREGRLSDGLTKKKEHTHTLTHINMHSNQQILF